MKRRILGLMSGTSLDGLDLCLAEFEDDSFSILKAETLGYNAEWKEKLSGADMLSGLDLTRLDRAYGRFLGESAQSFLKRFDLPPPEAIASHGHTIFHQPAQSFTLQIGHGASLAAASGLPVIADFRSLDVALGGQGAPLVPIGDLHLFKNYQACLNLGGFANISIKDGMGGITAFDICACNIVLNHLAQKLGKEYDARGRIAAQGTVNEQMLEALDGLDFFTEIGPKSLGKEWVVDAVLPIIDLESNIENALRTFCQHIARQIAGACRSSTKMQILVTGGGAHNDTLIDLIQSELKANGQLIIPSNEIIDFKEALIFAYLGYLFIERRPNALASVTGASRESIGGCLYNPT
jgi:anhydro-N-acetylmuramic acid kinase